MKQQAGIGILLALTTAICWGALPIAMKQVLEVMEPPTIVFYRFLMASIGLGAILAVKKRLPPLRVFRKPRWLILLAVATAGLFGNFILFSSSLQYLSPTASQVIGQLSPVGMMVASVFILKEKMRSTQVVGALMLLSGLVMFFNTSLVEIFTKLTDYTWGVIFGVGAATVWVSYGVAQKVLLRRLPSIRHHHHRRRRHPGRLSEYTFRGGSSRNHYRHHLQRPESMLHQQTSFYSP